jgi:antitoxin YefM
MDWKHRGVKSMHRPILDTPDSILHHEDTLAMRTLLRTFVAMTTITATRARAQLYKLIEASVHEPIQITGKRGNAVLVSEADWANIQETLHLAAIPGVGASIRSGLKEPLKKSAKKLRW